MADDDSHLVTQDQPSDLVACQQNDVDNRIEDEDNDCDNEK